MKVGFYKRALMSYINYKRGKDAHFTLFIYPTFRCNLKCPHCNIDRSKKKELEIPEYKRIISEASNIGFGIVVISGGEPLLRESIEELGKKIREKGMHSILLTNGTLVNDKNAKLIAKSFDTIRISVHGMKKIHDSITKKGCFEKLNKALNLLKGRTKIVMNMAVNENNEHEILAVAQHFKGLYDSISIIPVNSQYAYSSKMLKKQWKKLHELGISNNMPDFSHEPDFKKGKELCDRGRIRMNITPWGDVFPCMIRTSLGNIMERSLQDIISKRNDEIFESCNGCYLSCTTQVNQVFNMTPLTLAKNFIRLKRKI